MSGCKLSLLVMMARIVQFRTSLCGSKGKPPSCDWRATGSQEVRRRYASWDVNLADCPYIHMTS